MTARAALVPLAACAALAVAACGAPRLKLPSGPGTPASDAAAALDEATAACRGIRTLTAEIGVTGSVAGRRVRARLSAAVESPASARLEAVAPFGAPFFVFVATGEDATVLLPRDRRVLEHAPTAAVVEAIAGVPIDAGDLRAVLSGCAPPGAAGAGRALGDAWRAVRIGSDFDAYLFRTRDGASWRLAALLRRPAAGRGWHADFADVASGVPRRIRLTNADPAPAAESFDLDLSLSQVEVNTPLDASAFRVRVPSGAAPITLDELRTAGPLAAARASNRDAR